MLCFVARHLVAISISVNRLTACTVYHSFIHSLGLADPSSPPANTLEEAVWSDSDLQLLMN